MLQQDRAMSKNEAKNEEQRMKQSNKLTMQVDITNTK